MIAPRARRRALTLVFLVVALRMCATPASGQPAAPASVPVRASSGAVVCRAAPMPDGLYLVAHCLDHCPLYVGGAVPAYSVDRARDLAHLAIGADPRVRMRPAVVGEVLTWRSDRAAGRVRVTGAGAVIVFAHVDGSRLTFGDSGTGAYGDDGALVGVLSQLHHDGTNATPTKPARIGNLIGGGELVQVP